MDDYQIPEIPDYKQGFEGLVSCVQEFLYNNYPNLDFEKKSTKKGSIGYISEYNPNSNVSVFLYRDYDSAPMIELYWEERDPSKRYVSIKLPILDQTNYENSMTFIGGTLPVFLDKDIDHAYMSNEDMQETISDLLAQANVHGGLLSVEGFRGIEDDEAEPGEITMRTEEEPEMDNDTILDLIDKALEIRDFQEVERLRKMLKESEGLRHLKEFKKFKF